MIAIDTKQLAALEKRLGAVSKNAKRVMGRALSTTRRATKTETGRATAEVYTASKRTITANTKFRDANYTDLSFTITGLKAPIPLTDYKHRATKRSGVSVSVKKGTGAQRIPRAFKSTASNFGGNGGSSARIFHRVRKSDGGLVARLPIKALFGPSVADMLNSKQIQDRLGAFALKKLSVEIIRLTEVAFRG